MKTMTLSDGNPYIESPEVWGGKCVGCAFVDKGHLCDEAMWVAHSKAFGGDCVARNVIYSEADQQTRNG